jgi:DNA mismatch endonuclease (patch repair protein)
MPDSVDKATRSRIMASIKSKGNRSTEIKMARLLRRNRLSGWRRHYTIVGKPDFAWTREKVALFVDGCFWHGCPYCYRPSKSHKAFWEGKVKYNKTHDLKVSRELRASGWRVIRIWECKINAPHSLKGAAG